MELEYQASPLLGLLGRLLFHDNGIFCFRRKATRAQKFQSTVLCTTEEERKKGKASVTFGHVVLKEKSPPHLAGEERKNERGLVPENVPGGKRNSSAADGRTPEGDFFLPKGCKKGERGRLNIT